jgi:HSP20 family protein
VRQRRLWPTTGRTGTLRQIESNSTAQVTTRHGKQPDFNADRCRAEQPVPVRGIGGFGEERRRRARRATPVKQDRGSWIEPMRVYIDCVIAMAIRVRIRQFIQEKIMANLIRFDPYNLTRFDPFGDIDDLFREGFTRPALLENQPRMQIKMDVKEDDNAYTVHADIPGVKKEDIQVDIDGNRVSISAETKMEKEEKKGEKVLRSERYVGKVTRSFTLAHDVDESKSEAKYSDGVLELTLPKKASTAARKLAIK